MAAQLAMAINRARMLRASESIARKHIPVPTPAREPLPEPEPPRVLTPEEMTAAWVARQREIHPPIKFRKPWFLVIGEVDPESTERPRPSIEDIQRAAAKHFGVSISDMKAARRTKEMVLPRHVAVYLCKKLTLKSLPEIGRKFGGRDHTTQLAAFRKIERMVEAHDPVSVDVAQLIEQLGGAYD